MDLRNVISLKTIYKFFLFVLVTCLIFLKVLNDVYPGTFRTVGIYLKTAVTPPQFRYPMPAALSVVEKLRLEEALDKAQLEKKVILEWYSTKKATVTVKGVCGYCEIISDQSKIDDNETAAVVFNYKNIHAGTMPKTKRRLDQLYVWQTGEAPPALKYLHRRYFQYEDDYHFNVTQTFRRDADIYHPYGNIFNTLANKIRDGVAGNLTKVLEQKTKLAVAVMSNCHALPGATERLQFVRDLIADGLQVDTYGKCFKYKTYEKKDSKNFFNLLKEYKFYMSFENSFHCKDYITEKFFLNALELGLVPIVWGATRGDYDAVAPHGSFIYADDYNTTNELVSYLKYLDSNDTAYLEYFRWYQRPASYLPNYGRQMRYCQLCRILHGINVDDIFSPKYDRNNPPRPLISEKMSPRTMASLYNWYYREENPNCFKTASRFYRDNLSLAAKTLHVNLE